VSRDTERINLVQALILCGGQGTRLRPLTYKMAKPMIRIANKPFLLYIVGLLKKYNIGNLIFCFSAQDICVDRSKTISAMDANLEPQLPTAKIQHRLAQVERLKRPQDLFMAIFCFFRRYDNICGLQELDTKGQRSSQARSFSAQQKRFEE